MSLTNDAFYSPPHGSGLGTTWTDLGDNLHFQSAAIDLIEGDTVVVSLRWSGGVSTALVDSAGNVYAKIGEQAGALAAAFWFCSNVNGLSGVTFTATFSTISGFVSGNVSQYAGYGTATLTTSFASGHTTGVSPVTVTTSAYSAAAGALVVVFASPNDVDRTFTPDAPTGFTLRFMVTGSNDRFSDRFPSGSLAGETVTMQVNATTCVVVVAVLEPGTSTPTLADGDPGELAIITLTDRSGTDRPYSVKDGQNNLGTYYGGRVEPDVLQWKPIQRALSGAQGNLEHVAFGATLDDTRRDKRALLEDGINKYLKNRPLVARTVSDPDRRAEADQHTDMCGYVQAFSPTTDFQFDVDGTDWIKRKLARKTQAPEYWQRLLTREDWLQLPDALLNKAAPHVYGLISDEVEDLDLGDVPVDLYPRGGFDPGWVTFGRRGWGVGSFSPGTVFIWGLFIKDGVVSTVVVSTSFLMSGPSPATQLDFRCASLPDLFRFIVSDSSDFHPFNNPLAGSYARYIDVDPATIPEGNNPYGGPDPADANNRFALIDSPTIGNDYHALVTAGGSVPVSPAKGAWATLYVGEEFYGGVSRSAFVVSYAAISGISGVFPGGVRAVNVGSAYEIECPFLGDYASVFGANYRTINGRRWTVVYATGQTATDAINGSKPIWVNLTGYEDVGDTSGVPITSAVRIHQHFTRNFLAADTVPGGDWLTTSPLLPTGAPMLDDDRYDDAETAIGARISGGYQHAGAISAGGEFEAAEDILASLCVDGDFDHGISRHGSLLVDVEPSAAPSSPTALDDVLHILERSFSVRTDPNNNFWNVFAFNHTQDYTGQTTTGWALAGTLSDDASIANHEEEKPFPVWRMRWLRANTAQAIDTITDVLQRKRLRYRLSLRFAPLAIPYLVAAEADIELGTILRLTHVEGTGASGWVGRDIRVTKVSPEFNGWQTRIEGYDLQPIYDGLTDSTTPDWTSTGIQTQTIVSLQERVTTTQTDTATLQAEVVAIDALLVDLVKRGTVRAATTANVTISTALNNGDTLDGVTLATGDLVLVKNQSAPAENGVYVVGVTPARFSQYDTYDEHPGALLTVQEGTANADTLWICTSNRGGTLNTTAIAFAALVNTFTPSILAVLTSDPGSPVNGTAWLFDDGGSPSSVSLRVRKGGTTYDLPIGTLTT